MAFFETKKIRSSSNWAFILSALYGVSLLTSMAAMELFSGLIILFAVFLTLQGTAPSEPAPSIRWNKFDYLVLGFGCVYLVTLLLSYNEIESWKSSLGLLRYLILFLALKMVMGFVPSESWRKIYKLLFTILTIVTLYAITQFFWGIDLVRGKENLHPFEGFFRITGLFSLAITFSHTLGISAPLVYMQSLNNNRLVPSWLFFVGYISVTLALIFTISRGIWFGLIVAIVAMSLLARSWRLIGWVATALAPGIALFMSLPSLRDKILSLLHFGDNSTAVRVELLDIYTKIVQENWLLGVGWNQHINAVRQKVAGADALSYLSHPHNNYLQVATDTGAIGLAFFVAICVYPLVSLRKICNEDDERKFLSIGLLGAWLVFIVGGFTQCTFIDGENTHLIMVLWALTSATVSYRSGMR